MEQRLTLVSDPTDEFAQNKNNHFKVHIPIGLRLEGKGWHVALVSLTLPNSDSESTPFVTGGGRTVVKSFWRVLNFFRRGRRPYDRAGTYSYVTLIKEADVATASNGVDYWNNVVGALEQDIMSKTYSLKKTLAGGHDTLFVKESICPSFRWEGDTLIVKRRGTDSTDGRAVDTSVYSYFDIAYEVALQWGFIRVNANGKVIAGPHLRVNVFEDEITTADPQRDVNLQVRGIKTLNGKALRARRNLDMPRGLNKPVTGSSVYDIMWHYTRAKRKWIRLSGYVEWHLTNLNATYDAIHKHTGKAVMIYTNLQQSTVVGSNKAQLLRQLVVRRGGDAGHSYSEPDHLEWIPLSTRQTDIVEVQLADVDGHLLALPQGKSLVTVALKQML